MTTAPNHLFLNCRRLRIFLFTLFFLSPNAHSGDNDNSGLIEQIRAFQNKTGLQIAGMEKIQNGKKIPVNGNLEQQIKQLFSEYNHILIRNKKGKINRVVIVNKKQKNKVGRIVLPATIEGSHFVVSVAISGDGKIWKTLDMVIDTGADLVVLPDSMIQELGLTDNLFTQAKMQTANGVTDAKIGVLKELKITGETVENVEAAFVPGSSLGGKSLLGMSVLGRYQLNIDDKNRLITLIKK